MWCAGGNGISEYLQVDLGKVVTVTGLATQGSPSGTDWVKTYSVSYSNDKRRWKVIGTELSAKVKKVILSRKPTHLSRLPYLFIK